ncbi:DNA repair protein rad2 [Rhodotorula toruloides]
MGVQGLWSLLQPVARPVTLETLRDKRLAIDASMWIYQFQMATRDKKTGDTLQGAHIMGTFRRIMKLVFYGIKPVFVFDGAAPSLKKRTLEKRRKRKSGAGRDLAKTARELLSAQLRGHAVERELNRRKKLRKGKEKATDEVDEDAGTGDELGENVAYLEDLDAPMSQDSPAKQPSPVKADSPASPATPTKTPRKKYVYRDEYALPKIDGPLESRADISDTRIATEEELREFIEDLRPEDLDINSKFFENLPTEVKYEILGDLRIKTRQVNHRRVQTMRGSNAHDFSRAQIDHLMERNAYTQKLLSVTDELGKSALAIPTRVAGQRNREYVLVKQDVSKGGGWVLGVKNPEMSSNQPITIDSTTDDSVSTHTDTDEFEEVGFDSPEKKPVGLPTPDREARRALAEEAVRARLAAQVPLPAADPYLDQPVASTSRAAGLFQRDGLADEEDAALQQALYESAQTAPPLPLGGGRTMHSSSTGRTSKNGRARARPIPSSSRTAVSVTIPPRPTAPAAESSLDATAAMGNDTDDSMEYVDTPPQTTNGEPAARPAAAAANGAVVLSDTDDTDAFEEVSVTEPRQPVAASVQPPPAAARAPSLPSPPARLPSPPVATASTQPRTLFDSILPSDSDSDADTEASPRKRDSRPLPPAPPVSRPQPRPRSPPAFARLSPSPDPFESLENGGSAPGIQSHDFALEPFDTASSAPASHAVAAQQAVDVDPQSRRAANEPSGAVEDVAQTAVVRLASPTDLPDPLPPLEKALEAVETTEMAVLPDTLAQLPSPDLPPNPPNAEPIDQPPAREQPAPLYNAQEAVAEPPAAAPANAKVTDEEFFSDWSRSPSPSPDKRASTSASTAQRDADDWYDELAENEVDEAVAAMEREEEAYANMLSELRNEKIEAMRQEAERDVARLTAQRNAEARNADSVTRQMSTDIREMLILFGIPFVDAPSEAEAECAALLARQLVDGIVTDDSDVFLFGGSRIYRNMFNEAKYVECYLLSDLEREIGLDRGKLVRLAYLLGSDYTEGLPGVGPVVGRELLEEFPGKDGLKVFKAWWDKVQSGQDTEKDTNTSWKRRFKSQHRNLILDKGWPSAEVAQAYFRPVVEESDDRFSWGFVDLDGLRHYLHRSLGWDQTKADSILLPLIKREKERKEGTLKSQRMVTDFFDYSAGDSSFSRKKQPKYASKRLQNVVETWKATRDASRSPTPGAKAEANDDAKDEEATPEPLLVKKKRAPRKAPAVKKTTAASRKRKAKSARDARAAANGGVYSSEEDLRSDWEKEQGAGGASGAKSRTQPARKKRKAAVVVPTGETDEDE